MKPTVINLLNLGEKYLKRAGVLTYKLTSERLLEHIMQRDRISLYLDRGRQASRSERGRYFELLRERARRYPLQYLLREAHFMDFVFEVGEACLIPRPETELLVEHVLKEIRQVIPSGEIRVLDIGTGCGNIALSLARYLPFSEVWATDISEDILKLAERNAARLDVHHRVKFVRGSLFENLPAIKFECIVSNPPYLSSGDMKSLEGELLHEPKEALFGGADGTELMLNLADGARAFLSPGGLFTFEMGMNQAGQVTQALTKLGYEDVKTFSDYAGIQRIAAARWKKAEKLELQKLA